MSVSHLRRAGVLLLVLWLMADVAAFGFCGPELPLGPAASARIGAGGDSDAAPSCCSGHHCFCCSSGAEVMAFELSFDAHAAFMAPPPEPSATAISVPNTSPPPRF